MQTERPVLRFSKWLWKRDVPADRSREGFDAAVTLAMEHVAKYDYNHVSYMQDDILAVMVDALHSTGIHVDYIAVHRETRQPRLVISTDWGFRTPIDCHVDLTLTSPPKAGAPSKRSLS